MRQVILLVTALLMGCSSATPSRSQQSLPSTITLNTPEQSPLGKATALSPGRWVAPDSFLQDHQSLFWGKTPITIISRDFDHHIVFFSLLSTEIDAPEWSFLPPFIGQTLYYQTTSDKTSAGTVQSYISSPFQKEQTDKTVFILKGEAASLELGQPLFRDDGRIYGLVIGADKSQNEIYGLRSDKILELWNAK